MAAGRSLGGMRWLGAVVTALLLVGAWPQGVASAGPSAGAPSSGQLPMREVRDVQAPGIPYGGALVYGVGWGDANPVTQVGVGPDGQKLSTWTAPVAFELPLAANAGLVLVKTTPASTGGDPSAATVELRTSSGRTLRTVRGVPEQCSQHPSCWPLPGGRTMIRIADDGSVLKVNLGTGKATALTHLTSTFPDFQELSYAGAMSRHSRYLYVNDHGVLTRVNTRTGSKKTVFLNSRPEAGLELMPVCTTRAGDVIAWMGWYEGDPGSPPWGYGLVNPANGTYRRLALSDQIDRPAGRATGCTANGAYLIMQGVSTGDSLEVWMTVDASTGQRVGLGDVPNHEFFNRSDPVVDNGVGS